MDISADDLDQTLRLAVAMRRQALTQVIAEAADWTVQSGPFAGMHILNENSWNFGGDLAPKLLGCYEEEVQVFIEMLRQRAPATIVNIGCAEGYYAVGLARLCPDARVIAFDIDPRSQETCRRNAAANGVAERVEVLGECTHADLARCLAQPGGIAIVSDCEGAELDVLDPAAVPELVRADLIVECHDFIRPGLIQTLADRFQPSHKLQMVTEGARNPNRFKQLRDMSSLDRWIAVSEGRPVMMFWLGGWAHNP